MAGYPRGAASLNDEPVGGLRCLNAGRLTDCASLGGTTSDARPTLSDTLVLPARRSQQRTVVMNVEKVPLTCARAHRLPPGSIHRGHAHSVWELDIRSHSPICCRSAWLRRGVPQRCPGSCRGPGVAEVHGRQTPLQRHHCGTARPRLTGALNGWGIKLRPGPICHPLAGKRSWSAPESTPERRDCAYLCHHRWLIRAPVRVNGGESRCRRVSARV